MLKTRYCPYCGEEILATAKKCKHCGEWLSKEAENQAKNSQPGKKVSHKKEVSIISHVLAEFIGTVLGWAIVAMIIAAFTVPGEEKHIRKIESDVVECIQEKSGDALDAFGLSSYRGIASLFLDASQQGIIEAFYQQNEIEVKKHWFWSNGKIYNDLHPEGTPVSFGIFGFVIPYVDWDDIALLGENTTSSNPKNSSSKVKAQPKKTQLKETPRKAVEEQNIMNVRRYAGDIEGIKCYFQLTFKEGDYTMEEIEQNGRRQIVTGTYYYASQGADRKIILKGVYDEDNGWIHLTEYFDDGTPNANMYVYEDGNDFIGTFTTKKGKEMRMKMELIN